ncbi:hypothetical protein B0T26DRAFT_299147 [Lasiosphaeria miniovina]|uniref:Uncharacterized protein n=1 Tax=Lasiosphaeria miniovina TaxID=1954250 RepID=A0AA40AKJ1_9PEZI|nr:uncharacterized protein B0T26DRAFT_299147 [Lasiosphaeria miniovina]KAK0717551.1 hypothetical protein B0T26DRAFT_299147 [Lasiosphaeria miniovina]
MATNSKFGGTTPGSEVAKFFPDQVRGKIGDFTPLNFTMTTPTHADTHPIVSSSWASAQGALARQPL